jgi:hypothetical protein
MAATYYIVTPGPVNAGQPITTLQVPYPSSGYEITGYVIVLTNQHHNQAIAQATSYSSLFSGLETKLLDNGGRLIMEITGG